MKTVEVLLALILSALWFILSDMAAMLDRHTAAMIFGLVGTVIGLAAALRSVITTEERKDVGAVPKEERVDRHQQ